jgi:hypothetical protein
MRTDGNTGQTHRRARDGYPSDLRDTEWAGLEKGAGPTTRWLTTLASRVKGRRTHALVDSEGLSIMGGLQRIGEGTFTGTRANDENASIPVVRRDERNRGVRTIAVIRRY